MKQVHQKVCMVNKGLQGIEPRSVNLQQVGALNTDIL